MASGVPLQAALTDTPTSTRSQNSQNKRKEISPIATDTELTQNITRRQLGELSNDLKIKYLQGMGKEPNVSPNIKKGRKSNKLQIRDETISQEQNHEKVNNSHQSVKESENDLESTHSSLRSSLDDITKNMPDTSEHDTPQAMERPKRLPPIFIEGLATKELIGWLKSNSIVEGFSIKNNIKVKKISLWADSYDIYNIIRNKLIEKDIKFYTFTPRQTKPITLVLKGLSLDTTEADINTAITNLNLEKVSITKISILKTNANSKLFLIQLSPQSLVSNLTKIRRLEFQRVSWEPLRKNNTTQCKKCQRLGHVASNCNMGYRCVKCPTDHGPGQCKITNSDNREILYCTNCMGHGHPASYKGCPYIREATKKKTLPHKRESEINSQSITTQGTVAPWQQADLPPSAVQLPNRSSYASVTKKNKTENFIISKHYNLSDTNSKYRLSDENTIQCTNKVPSAYNINNVNSVNSAHTNHSISKSSDNCKAGDANSSINKGSDDTLMCAFSNVLNNFKTEMAKMLNNYNKNLNDKISENAKNIRIILENLNISLESNII